MKKLIVSSFILLLLVSFISVNEKTTQAAEMNFSVTALLPDNQINKSNTYFDLLMKPGQEQIVQVEMKNNTEEDVTVEVNPNTAITNDNGIADYSQQNTKVDSTLKIPFSSIATAEKELTIPKKSKKTIDINLHMPKNEFDGIILGGIHFVEKENEQDKKNQDGVQIKNKFAYVIGVSLRENDTVVEPQMKLNNIKAGQINFRNVVKLNLQNSSSTIIKDLNVDAKIYKKNSKEVLYESDKQNLRMAPNSNFDYSVDWQNKELKPGKYTALVKAESGDNEWEWKKDFEIDGATASSLNKKAVELEKDYSIYYIIGILLLFLVLIGIIIYLVVRNKKKEEERKQALRKKILKKRKEMQRNDSQNKER